MIARVLADMTGRRIRITDDLRPDLSHVPDDQRAAYAETLAWLIGSGLVTVRGRRWVLNRAGLDWVACTFNPDRYQSRRTYHRSDFGL